MEEEQKKELITLLAGAVLWAAAFLLPEGLWRTLAYIAIYLFIGFEVVAGMIREAREGEIFTEETLMTLATVGALILGEYPEAVAVMLLYRVGEWFADLAVDSSRESIRALTELRPDNACVLRGGEWLTVPPAEVQTGETVRVLPGERIPLDGEIVSGFTTVDTSALTGESLPRDKGPGDELFSGCVNVSGQVEMRVLSEENDSAASRIMRLTEEAQSNKSKSEDFIRRFAKVYTPAVCAAALLLGLVPSLITGGWSTWVHRALVFLTVSCPCALVVSVPLSFFCGIGCASRHGVLVKGSVHLEALADADICAFDKTGTLTTGGFRLKKVTPEGVSKEELVRLAAAAERFSSHPVARCVAQEAHEDVPARLIYEKPGMGVKAEVGGKTVLAGNRRLLAAEGVEAPDIEGSVFVAADGTFIGSLVVGDDVKPSAAPAVQELRRMGFSKTVMLSGDRPQPAEAVGREVGLDEVYSSLLPAEKVERMQKLSQSGKPIYTGDGINDAPVLAAAHVGAAMGGLGSDAAIETADVVIMDDDLRRLPRAVSIARRTLSIAKQNIIASLAVKFLILGLGIFVTIPMYVAIIGDVGVLLAATLNALRALRA
ncbi:MAG: cadmium-translocating P-type ATPase [Clostridia bacterium]|nr:cadmium-translocating P-type ATPase [Clostridia bacterium]